MIEKYISPHTDFGFKRLFGSEFNKELKMYEDSVNAYRDIVNAIRTAEKKKFAEGRAEGMAEGMEKGMSQRSLEIARKMLAKGMDEASIMDMTGLTAEEIKLLKAEM